MEGYYDGTIFHRILKDFIAQGEKLLKILSKFGLNLNLNQEVTRLVPDKEASLFMENHLK